MLSKQATITISFINYLQVGFDLLAIRCVRTSIAHTCTGEGSTTSHSASLVKFSRFTPVPPPTPSLLLQVFSLIATFPGFELPSLLSIMDFLGSLIQLDLFISVSVGSECAGKLLTVIKLPTV